MQDLNGKVAVVTGGAGGIGKALVERFVDEGMRVVVADVEEGALDKTVAELAERGGEVIGVRTDVTSFESVVALADRAYEAFGVVHLLVNNAGVGPPGGLVWETTPNDWKWTFGVNVFGVAHGCKSSCRGCWPPARRGWSSTPPRPTGRSRRCPRHRSTPRPSAR